jgi:hypothetical protein
MRFKKYGILPQEYVAMLAAQAGRCAIKECNKEPTDVDHCHETGLVRALLCGRHNRIAGMANDDPRELRKTADYLEFHQARIASVAA